MSKLLNNRTTTIAYISKKIKDMRKATGWTQSELASKAGITGATISQIEKGDRLPSLIVSHKLAEALDISVEEFTGDIVPSSLDKNNEDQIFLRKFGDIKTLSANDQELIKKIVGRLKND